MGNADDDKNIHVNDSTGNEDDHTVRTAAAHDKDKKDDDKGVNGNKQS